MTGRSIKFRIWDAEQKHMFLLDDEQSLTCSNEQEIKLVFGKDFHDDFYDSVIDNFALMQFTGLHDVNGKEIYEGDIVQWNTLTESYNKPVRWDNKEAMFLPNHMNRDVEIIGNIYENPELSK